MFESLGHYRILDRIGVGGIGDVYRARDTRLGRTVAVKLLKPEISTQADQREQFVREAQAAARLSHPNIAALYEVGDDQGQVFLVFEFVPGEPLTKVMSGRPINPRRAIDLAVQLGDALADAHAAGIVHRDLKPDNIIVTPKGNAKILDFGLANWTAGGLERDRAARAGDSAAVTAAGTTAGTALGTVPYMSPEQVLGEPVDERTDIFSLGIVLFEMLTGRPPFTSATATAIPIQIVQTAAPVPSAVNRTLPRELDTIVAHALAKSLDGRYSAAATLAAELRAVAAILETRSSAGEPLVRAAPVRPEPRARRRWPVVVLIALLAAVAALIGAAWCGRSVVRRGSREKTAPVAAAGLVRDPERVTPGRPMQERARAALDRCCLR